MKSYLKLIAAGLVLLFAAACDKESGTGVSEPLFELTSDGVSETGARLGARIQSDLGRIEASGFLYRAAADEAEPMQVEVQERRDEYVYATLSGLQPATQYSFSAYAVVAGERYVSPRSSSFTTLSPQTERLFGTPRVTELTAGSAAIACDFAYDGVSGVEMIGFYWKSEEQTSYQLAECELSTPAITVTLTDLQPQTDYLVYAFVQMGEEFHQSVETSFTTPAQSQDVPAFTELAATEVTASSAVLSGKVAYAGDGQVSRAGFEYKSSAQSDYAEVQASSTGGELSVRLSGLSAATAYSYRMFAEVDGVRYVSGVSAFTTQLSESTVNTRYAGWAELPDEDAQRINSEYYYAYHLCPDYPSSGTKARNFTSCYSRSMVCPVWVAAPLHDCYTGTVTRTNAYRTDPDIDCTQAGKWSNYTRGHLLGSNERRVTREVNRDVFYYSNIGPQIQTYFNTGGGQWNVAEDWVDKQWRGLADTCYQVVGTYWENTDEKVGSTTIPTHYYIVLLKTKESAGDKWAVDCTAGELQCIGIMVRHKAYAKSEVTPATQFESEGIFMTVERIEELTGHTFFSNVPNAPKGSYDLGDWNF